jgi:hypothetical protein
MKKIIITALALSVLTPMSQASASCDTGYGSAVEVNATTKVVTYSCVKLENPPVPPAQGAWVKVDANGNATGQAIVCSSDVCGDNSSPYAKATLGAGEQYVLQANADPVTNNVVGVGNNNANTQVRVDIPTQEWTITRTHTVTPEVPLVINNQIVIAYTVETTEKFKADKAQWIVPVKPIVVPTETEEAITEATTKTKTTKAKKNKTKKKAAKK